MTIHTNEYIRREMSDSIGLLRLNRPVNGNAPGTGMLHALADALGEFERDDAIRVVVISGEGVFCAEADLKEMRDKGPAEAESLAGLAHDIFHRIEAMEKPVIAAVSGYAPGGGCEPALACDLRVADEGAKFGQPEINPGLIRGFGATQRLPRLIDLGRAKELIMAGRSVGAAVAAAIGLVNAVTAEDGALRKAMRTAAALASKSPPMLKIVKRLTSKSLPIDRGLETKTILFAECFLPEDRREGFSAFFEERPAIFTGR